MEAALQAMLTTTLQHQPYTGQDSYGAPSYGSLTLRPARLDWKTARFVSAQGEERISRAIAYLAWDFDLDLRDKLVLPDGTAPALQRIDAYDDEEGEPHHYKVFF
jgi:hypothetical protein